jgi:predicted secreted Zn-dependent protease
MTATPTIAITSTLIAATLEIGYIFSAETRGAVTLRTTEGIINYLVGGKTADEIAWQMSILGPRDEIGNFVWFGLTDPNYDWDYACTCTDSGCKPPTVTINLLTRYLIPHWSESGMEHESLAAYWSYFEGALLAHERGHGEIAMQCGWQFGDALIALPPASTCEAFDASVQAAVVPAYQSCRLIHRTYDDETGHGASQGVVWPPTIP